MNDRENKKYTVQYMIDNIYGGTEIFFIFKECKYFLGYQPSNYSHGFTINSLFKKKTKKESKGYYFMVPYGNYENIKKYETPRDLFENAKIGDERLIDIWHDVKITSISGFDQY